MRGTSAFIFLVLSSCAVRQHYDLGDSQPPLADGAEPSTSLPPSASSTGDTAKPEPVVLVSGEYVQNFVVGGAEAYWINDQGEIRSVSVNGGTPSTLATGWSTTNYLGGASQDATHVYFVVSPPDRVTSGIISRVVRIAKETHAVTEVGSTRSELPITASDPSGALSLMVHKATVYWIAVQKAERVIAGSPQRGALSGIHACPTSGCRGEARAIYTEDRFDSLNGLAMASDDTLVTANFNRDRLWGIRDDGKGRSWTFFETPGPEGVFVDGDAVYVASQLGGGVNRDLSLARCQLPSYRQDSWSCGGPVTIVASGPIDLRVPSALTSDETHVYWSNFHNSGKAIMRCPKDSLGCGEHPEVVIDLGSIHNDRGANHLQIDAKAVYWADRHNVMKLAKPASKPKPH